MRFLLAQRAKFLRVAYTAITRHHPDQASRAHPAMIVDESSTLCD